MIYISLLLFLSCINTPSFSNDKGGICIGQRKNFNEFFCYHGIIITQDECLDYGYEQHKKYLDFTYNTDLDCEEFCEQTWENQAYGSDLECSIINLDGD